MTLRQYFEAHLCGYGLFETQAREVMDRVVADKANAAMSDRWKQPSTAYSDFSLIILAVRVSAETDLYLKEKHPRHWARPIFDKTHPLHAAVNAARAGQPACPPDQEHHDQASAEPAEVSDRG